MPEELQQPNNSVFADSRQSFFMRHLMAEILGVVLAGAVLAGGYWYYTTYFQVPETKTPVHVEKKDKTYTNKEYGFEFKYPVLGINQKVLTSGEVTAVQYQPKNNDEHYVTIFTFEAYKNSTQSSVTDWFKQLDKKCNEPLIQKDFYTTTVNDQGYEILRLEGFAPVDYDYDTCGIIGSFYYINSAEKDRIVSLNYTAHDVSGIEEFDNTISKIKHVNQMLSTFKFIEPVVVNSYASCIAAGNPMMKSFPPKCSADGVVFVQPQGACIQVIATAKNPETGETREFPTPCDVPEGWEKVSS